MSEYNDSMVDVIVSESFKNIAMFCFLASFPLFLAIYVCYLLYKSCKSFITVKLGFREMLVNKYVNPLTVASNDNEVYKKPKDEEHLMEYEKYNFNKINQNVTNTVSDSDTISYNKNQQTIWNTIYDKDPIDIIDRNALLKENDNW